MSGWVPVQHLYRSRVAWVDTDASGRIHFTAALRWMDAAEHSLLRSLGYCYVGGFPRVDVRAIYSARLDFEDEIDVAIGVASLGRTSINYVWRVLRGDTVCVYGNFIVVHVEEPSHSIPIADDLRADLAAMLPPGGMPHPWLPGQSETAKRGDTSVRGARVSSGE